MTTPCSRRVVTLFVVTVLSACGSASPPPPDVDLAAARARWSEAGDEPLPDSDPPENEATLAPARPAVSLTDGLDLDEGTQLCAWLSPRLRLARLLAVAPRAAIPYAGLWDDPKVSLEARRVLGGVDEPDIVGAGIAFTIPLGGQKRAAVATAQAEGDVATCEAAVEEWSELYELRRDWVEWSHDGRQLELLDRLSQDLQEFIAIARPLAEGGVIGLADVRILELEQGTRAIERRRRDVQHRARRLSILARIGLSARSAVVLSPSDTLSEANIAPGDRPTHIAQHHPELALALVKARLSHALDDEAWRRALPELVVSPGIERDQGESKLGASLETTLPLWNLNRAERAEATASARATRLAVLVKYRGILDALATRELELEAARDIASTIERELEPLAKAQLEALREQARLGALDALRLIEAVVRRHETNASLLEARRDAALATIAVNQLLDAAAIRGELSR